MASRRSVQSTLFKLGFIFVLGVVVWIPTLMVGLLAEERAHRRDEAVREVSATWGGRQTVRGPLLVIPVERSEERTDNGQPRRELVRSYLFILPETLEVSGVIEPEQRRRGIFDVVLHRSRLRLAGAFPRLDPAAWAAADASVRLDQAQLAIGVSELRGLAALPALTLAGAALHLEPSPADIPFPDALVAAAPLDPTAILGAEASGLPFELELELAGSGPLAVVPLGYQTTASLSSPWTNPSFGGAALPARHELGPDGFSAEWKLLSLGRELPQHWLGASRAVDGRLLQAMDSSAFSVELKLPVDAYQKVIRSVKYAVLFALVTFVGFFAVEHDAGASIHPVQYLVVAFGLCVFYSLLLSLSELMPFGLAFAVAAAALVAMVWAYLHAVLGRRGAAAAAVLAGVYAALYVMLQLEELALLLGSLFLLGVLATLMLLTRKVGEGAVGAE